MVEPKLKDRFENAQEALDALKPLDITRCPQVEFSHQIRDFKATYLGEKIQQSITIENLIPDTLLEGCWEVAYHPNDPLHKRNSHPWITVTPIKLAGNHRRCDVKVDTSQLMADKLYKRQLFLHTNGYPKTHTLPLKVQTASMPIERRKSSYTNLIWAFLTGEIVTITAMKFIALIVAILVPHQITFWNIFRISDSMSGAGVFGTVGAIVGAVVVPVIIGIYKFFAKNQESSRYSYSLDDHWAIAYGIAIAGLLGIISGSVYGTIVDSSTNTALLTIIYTSIQGIIAGGLTACIAGGIAGMIIGLVSNFLTWATLKIINDWLSLLTAIFGVSVGVGFVVGFVYLFTMLALGITGIPLLYALVYLPTKHHRLIAKYRHSEQNLIEP